jgi:hypothetical protein
MAAAVLVFGGSLFAFNSERIAASQRTDAKDHKRQ